jgi:hypothetical protein
MQDHQPLAQPHPGAGGDHAMFDVTEPGAFKRDHPPTHPAQAGVEAKNANR